jgi:hypothetical protein
MIIAAVRYDRTPGGRTSTTNIAQFHKVSQGIEYINVEIITENRIEMQGIRCCDTL